MQWMNEGADWLLHETCTADASQPELLAALGAGLAGASARTMVGYAEGSDYARAAAMTVCGAIAAAGGDAVLVPDCTPVELGAASGAGECGMILFADETRLRLYARGLLPVTAEQERLLHQGGIWQRRTEYGSITDGAALRMLYPAQLAARLPAAMTVTPEISTGSKRLYALLSRTLPQAQRGRRRRALSVQLSADGRQASVYTEEDGWLFHEKLLMMVTQHKLSRGEDAALPYWAAHIAEQMAERSGGRILRYAARSDGSDTEARALAAAQGWTLDGTLLLAEVLRIHAEEEPSLHAWADRLPPVYTVRRLLHKAENTDAAAGCGTFMQTQKTPDGLRAWDSRGQALLCPSASGRSVAMLVEAATMEAAQEIAGDIADAVRRADN
jgi:mannose-1-phosphate guanylyltransferase/phosphomannomutase